MFKSFFKFMFHFVVYALCFLILVWVLLGISPDKSYEKFKGQISVFSRQIRSISGTADKISNAASNQLQKASDRFHGKDPYEKINSQLNASMK